MTTNLSRWAPRLSALLLTAGLGGLAFLDAGAVANGSAAGTRPSTRLIVRFAPGTDATQRQAWLDATGRQHGLRLQAMRQRAGGDTIVAVDVALGSLAQAHLLEQLAADARVAHVEADRLLAPALIEGDPQPVRPRWHLDAIRAPLAWKHTTGTGVVVAVVDTGVTAHPDLAPNLVAGYDFVSDAFVANDGDGRDADATDPGDRTLAGQCPTTASPANSSWHGTRVAGTVAAVGGKDFAGRGVAPGAKVMPLRALGRCGGHVSDIADAIVWAAGGAVPGVPANPDPVEVVLLPLSGAGTCDATLQQAIDFAVSRGTAVVAAAGNEGTDVARAAPANCDQVIVVGAVDAAKAHVATSNVGARIDLVAPGGGADAIVSLANAGTVAPGTASVAGYRGTSAAAAQVAGVAALAQSVKPRTPAELERLLKMTAQPTAGCAQGCGAGLVDAAGVVRAAATPTLTIGSPVTIMEGDDGVLQLVEFTVSLSEAAPAPIQFGVYVFPGGSGAPVGGAEAGKDYVDVDFPAQVFEPGVTSRKFTVPVMTDTRGEIAEGFHVSIGYIGDESFTIGQPHTVYATIQDDDLEVLDNGVPLIVEGADIPGIHDYSEIFYRIDVPAGMPTLYISASGPTYGPRLLASPGTKPSASVVNPCSDYWNSGQGAYCVINNPAPGPWYVMLRDIGGWLDVELEAHYTAPGLRVSDAKVVEGDTGSKTLVFTASLPEPATAPVTFSLATANGTATAGSDYTATTGTGLAIATGMQSRTFNVPVAGDTTVEANETFTVNLGNVVGATVSDPQGTGTLIDDDGPSLSIANAAMDEANGALVFTVSLSQAVSVPVSFDIATVSGTATAGADFMAKSELNRYLLPGATSTTFAVQIQDDTSVEPNETFSVVLDNVAGAGLRKANATGTIRNVDRRELTIGDVSIVEGDTGSQLATFTVTLNDPSPTPITFDVATTNAGTATAGVDFVALPSTQITLEPYFTSATFSVQVLGDLDVEGIETIEVAATNAVGAYTTDATAIASILPDELPTLSVADASIVEGNSGSKLMTFVVTLSQAVASPVRYYTYAQVTGDEPGEHAEVHYDFTADWGMWREIPAGQLSHAYTVEIKGDTSREPDENFTVIIQTNWDATVVDGRAIGTIRNDDGPLMSIDDVTVAEGTGGTPYAAFTVRLSKPSTVPVTFDVATADGSASAGTDYIATTIEDETIPAGAVVRQFNVPLVGDAAIEGHETFVVTLANPVGASITDSQATATLLNDDGPVLSVNDMAIVEGAAGTRALVFTVSLSQAAATDVGYTASTGGGTATSNVDYAKRIASGQVIPAGQTSKAFSVTINGDAAVEANESFTVTLSAPTGASILDAQGTGTILNDDGPTLSIGDASVVEGASGTKTLAFTVSLSQAAAAPVTFDVTTGNGTAIAGSDYVARSLTGQSIAAGQLSKTFAVTINGDTAVEGNETLLALVSNVAGVSLSDGQAAGTIVNDDGARLSISDPVVTEGHTGTRSAAFTVSLGSATDVPVSFTFATANGTATAGTDYTARNFVETIPAGSVSKVVNVSIVGDTVVEGNEAFTVNLANATGASMFDGQAVGTIRNDDGPTLSIADAGVLEGPTGTKNLVFTVSLSQASAEPVVFTLATDPASGSATAGVDYVGKTLSNRTLAPGSVSMTFNVTINGDATVEGNETLYVDVTNATGASIYDGRATGTITNDD